MNAAQYVEQNLNMEMGEFYRSGVAAGFTVAELRAAVLARAIRVNEAMNAEGDVYSNEAMFRALASSPSREPASVLRHMLDDVSVHVNGNTASDDMTILCVRYFGGKR